APACTTPIASITDITGMEINDTGTQVIVSWPPIPCQPVVYKVTRSADRGGRIEQIELATPIAVTSLATRTTSMRAVDQPVSTGLFQANYQVEATLPDGRAVSSAWRMWIAGGSSGAMTETTSSGPRLQVDGEPGTTPRPPGLADSLAQASPQLWDLWLAPAGGAALVYWRGVLAATDCIVTWSDPRPGGRAFRFPVSCGNKVSDAGSEGFWAGNLPVTDATSLVLRVEARFADGTLRFAEETVTADQPPFYRFLLSRPSATELRACAGLPRSIWDQRLVFKFNSAGGVDQQESDYWLFGVSGSLANDPVKYPMKAWWPHHRIWGTGLPAEGKRLSFSVEDVFSTNGAAWCLTWSYPYRIDEKITLASAPTDSSGVPTVPFTRRWVTEWVILEPTEDDLTDIRPVSSSYSGAGLP
ncbi:MAG: hypothetical protein L6Q83_11765, partial [Gammaproteobacteria bacterium]|nr:hypothetical protein [Gammaproteobacteria bacterium]